MEHPLDATSIANNLAASFIGVLIGLGIKRASQVALVFSLRWFWRPVKGDKIFIHFGERGGLLAEEGEVEPLVHLADARSAIELRSFLSYYYRDVVIATKERDIDWNCPVVSLGGPVSNHVSREILDRELLPINFLHTPYTSTSVRKIGTSNESEVYQPVLADGSRDRVEMDVGYLVRMRSPHNPEMFLFLIAACYGGGTWAIASHSMSFRNMLRLRFSRKRSESFQQVFRIRNTQMNPRVELIVLKPMGSAT